MRLIGSPTPPCRHRRAGPLVDRLAESSATDRRATASVLAEVARLNGPMTCWKLIGLFDQAASTIQQGAGAKSLAG